ncbi:MAG TPA: histidine--tRNA ligase [Phycisphaerales bacterium]|nr:histidine--tRNA ligase [Phycisphaerales bacterium]
MKIPSVKGTRDFYPPQMAVRNFISNGWKAVSLRNGFVEYDGPIFEYLRMYQIKSGDEIVEQLFHLTDRGGRELAIRPEITPTLARMINQRINALPRPIKWFSVPRLCRAERPQKGRLREFFQWNIDIVGVDDILADAEVIFCTLDYLRSAGLTAADITAKISSRKLLAALLMHLGIAEDQLETLYPILDKKAKLPADTFAAMLAEAVANQAAVQIILKLLDIHSVGDIQTLVPDVASNRQAQSALDELHRLFDLLKAMGVADFCRFDMSIVRGLAYYTGMVFEVHDAVGDLRAVCGGGRYDNLLRDFGGPALSATGMGMGDCVLEILLRERGLLTESLSQRCVDFFVVCMDEVLMPKALDIVSRLRSCGKSTEFSYKTVGLGKQLKLADACGARQVIIIGQEYLNEQKIILKDMKTGTQSAVDESSLFVSDSD